MQRREEDDLPMTSIDLDKKAAKERSIKKQQREERKLAIDKIRSERGRWFSERSELIMYAKMLSDYFSFVNNGSRDSSDFYDGVSRKMEVFCAEHKIQVKAMKEVHYLCL